jgi:hypothetical protein
MKQLFLICSSCLCIAGFGCGEGHPGRVDDRHTPALHAHFEPEHAFDKPMDSRRWTQETQGLHAAFGSTDTVYFRSEVPTVSRDAQSWEGTGWRGERLNALVLVWSPEPVEQVRFALDDLVDAEGHTLSKDSIHLRMVRYVLSDYPYDARNATCEGSPAAAWLLPDRLEAFQQFDVPGRTVRPVWFSLDIPHSATPGKYQGTLRVASTKQRAALRLNINVQSPALPPPREWKFRLDLWQNPWVIAWYYNVQPWSDEHKALLKEHLKLYAEAGGKYITTYAIHSPWQDNSYMIEGTMIEWIKQRNGAWRFDYRIFDDYVSLAMSVGIDQAITIYTPVPWGHRFRYLDERTGNYIHETWPPASDAFRNIWRIFLDDLKRHLEDKGWLEATYLGINENPLQDTLAAVKAIKDHSQHWKITYAGDWHPELDALLDDYCSVFGREPSMKDIRARSARGFTTTYYVACNPPKPNTFVFSPPAEARWLGWYAAAHGYDGFLRWAYDAWPADPVRDARHTLWPAGDTFLVYPGGNSSIRFEKLREGIVDFEKIRLLRSWVSQSTDKEAARLTNELERQLKSLAATHEIDEAHLRQTLKEGTSTLAAMSERLTQ